MALPQLTDEQRAAALEKAAAARRIRAELKDRLKRGGTNLQQVLKDAETDEVLGKMKVSALLEALPKVGKVKAQEIMTEADVFVGAFDEAGNVCEAAAPIGTKLDYADHGLQRGEGIIGDLWFGSTELGEQR